MNTEIEKRKTGELADFSNVAETLGYDGFENVTDDLISLPFLKIAQPNSPELLPDGGIEGLKAGQFFNSVSGRVYGAEVHVILLGFDVSFLEWDSSGLGKLIGRMSKTDLENAMTVGDVEKDDFKLRRKETGNDIKETHTFFVMLPEYPEDGVMLLSFKSTGLKHVRKWLTKARSMRWTMPDGRVTPAPLFGCIWHIKAMLNKNDQGNWYLLGDAKTMTATRVGTLLDDKYSHLQSPVTDAVSFVKDVQFKVDMTAARDVTDSAKEKDDVPF